MREAKRKRLLIIQTERLTERKDRHRNFRVTVVNEAILKEIAVRQTQTAAWHVNRVNIVMKCFNRYPIPKLDLTRQVYRNTLRSAHTVRLSEATELNAIQLNEPLVTLYKL